MSASPATIAGAPRDGWAVEAQLYDATGAPVLETPLRAAVKADPTRHNPYRGPLNQVTLAAPVAAPAPASAPAPAPAGSSEVPPPGKK